MELNHEQLSRQEQKAAKALALAETVTNLENGTFEVYHFVGGVSDVWEQFYKIRECNTKNHVDYAQCIECKALLSFKEASGTSHLARHKCHQGRGGESDGFRFRCLPMEKLPSIKKSITNNIIKFCASDFLSCETVCDSTNFIDYAQSFVLLGHKVGYIDLRNVFPSSKYVNTKMVDLKEKKMRELYLNFQEAFKNNWCSLTIEMKTFGDFRKNNRIAVMSVQYFEKDLARMMKKFILSVVLDGKETSENFLIKLIKEFSNFGGDKEDLFSLDIVTPNEDLFSKALNCPYKRGNCYVNIITNILNEAFKSNDTLINCQYIVKHISSKEKYNIKLIEDNGTWKGKMGMIKSIHENYDGILKIFENENIELNFNKRKAEDIISYLELFVEAIVDLSSTSHSTANKIFLWWIILTDYLKKNENFSSELKRISAATHENLKTMFRPTIDNKINTFLDPRYKSLTMLSDIERSYVLEEVRSLLEHLDDVIDRVDEAPPAMKKSRFANFEGSKVNKEKNKGRNKKDSSAQNRFARFETKNNNLNDDDEVNIYVKLPEMDSDDFDTEFGIINQFWKQKQKLLPKLSKLATTRLHVPACCGSVSLSRLTSKEDLKHEMINNYLFVHDNFDQLTC